MPRWSKGHHSGYKGGCAGIRKNGLNSKIEGALFNDNEARYFVQRERPWHRQMIEMATLGLNAKEIASAVAGTMRGGQVTERTVQNTLRQPWARERIVNTIAKNVKDELHDLLENQAKPSILKLVEIRDSTNSKPSEQAAAANSLLDRYLGRATQPIETTTKQNVSNLTTAELEKLAAAQAEIARDDTVETD